MQNAINFIFFGRLEKEKGFDLVLKMIERSNQKSNIFFYIFGDGSLAPSKKKFDNVSFFGRQSKDKIYEYLKKSHYCLMPSLCLESFGLTALEAISNGIPVIGFKKGGLSQFVFDELDISRQVGQNDLEKIINLFEIIVNNFDYDKWMDLSKSCLNLSKNFTMQAWIEKFKGLILL